MMLEYMYINFKHFGHNDLHVPSLSDFLLQIDDFNCEGLFELLNHAAEEIIMGWLTFTLNAGLHVATCGVANAARFDQLGTNFSRLVASLANAISRFINFLHFLRSMTN